MWNLLLLFKESAMHWFENEIKNGYLSYYVLGLFGFWLNRKKIKYLVFYIKLKISTNNIIKF